MTAQAHLGLSMTRRLDRLSWPEAEKALQQSGSTVVWPMGALEQHGPHLPLATDALFSEQILSSVLSELAPNAPIWSLPTQSIGFSPEHSGFPGTLSLSSGLLTQLIIEVGGQLCTQGVKRLVLLFNQQLLSELWIEDRSGQKTEFSFSDQLLNRTVSPALFQFSLPDGVEFDDQRTANGTR